MSENTTNQVEPVITHCTTTGFPVFITRAFPKGFQVGCACGYIGNQGEKGTDFTSKAPGLIAIYRKHEAWHRQNWLASQQVQDQLVELANDEPAEEPKPKAPAKKRSPRKTAAAKEQDTVDREARDNDQSAA